jgi:hypothetical protein
MSYKAEVQVKGEGERWHDNALRFATKEEAVEYAKDLYSRWTLTTAYRAVESEDPVNYVWQGGKALPIPKDAFGYGGLGDEMVKGGMD